MAAGVQGDNREKLGEFWQGLLSHVIPWLNRPSRELDTGPGPSSPLNVASTTFSEGQHGLVTRTREIHAAAPPTQIHMQIRRNVPWRS